ncbi:MAG: carbamoyltransferase HypF [Bacteroidales bacterium]|nr:carbamoyltransferase HypF [Bacteroidales bacterium]
MGLISWDIRIQGLVQGVGFRPFIYRIALANDIRGWVENNNEGVRIMAEARHENLTQFIADIRQLAPPASLINSIEVSEKAFDGYPDFNIRKSSSVSDAVTEVSPDIAVCSDCLSDMRTQAHRIAYPFINCTNCGPRFSIIKALPYDRHLTTMEPFVMCETCKQEYTNILDRRFHAQPVACLHCGPHYTMFRKGLDAPMNNHIVEQLSQYIDQGLIVALKGIGGYHFVCDALNEDAVALLRERKNREGKPMAVMTGSLEKARDYFQVSEQEAGLLLSWRRPIVLLNNRKPLAASVSKGLNSTGLVLPYMPIHFQLFELVKTEVIVLTSGNLSDEPVTISDALALEKLFEVADVVVSYNREIHNRTDDSVAMVINGKDRLIRRSRGWAPSPVNLQLNTEGIFAAGAELVNTFAIGKGSQAILSQHIGDLKNAETLAFYEESYQRFTALFRFQPGLVACDLHPDYLSSQFARSLGVETLEIQHHHAHIASCMAENGLDEQVIGIAFDGTGYGPDGTIWGGEFLTADLSSFQRSCYFDPVPLPGGDLVTAYPWRTAVSYLHKYIGPHANWNTLPFLSGIDPEELDLVLQALDRNLNCPLSSGAGRLFDAVAALTGLCTQTKFHAEAPMMLESIMAKGIKGKYLVEVIENRIVFRKMFYQLIKDIHANVDQAVISAKFHNTIVSIVLTIARKMHTESGCKKVVLSGGSFQNKYLLSVCEQLLSEQGFEVFSQSAVPSNDGGIALGQMAIAAKYMENKSI